jgi:hypothetical protein
VERDVAALLSAVPDAGIAAWEAAKLPVRDAPVQTPATIRMKYSEIPPNRMDGDIWYSAAARVD